MNNIPNSALVHVELSAEMITALLQIASSLDQQTGVRFNELKAEVREEGPASFGQITPTQPSREKYLATLLGERLSAPSLPELFGRVIDAMAGVAPEAVEALASMKSHRRRFVSRIPEGIHPGRRDLPVMKTSSDWWISRNIGREDLVRGLRALAEAAGLEFGDDITFAVADRLQPVATVEGTGRDGSFFASNPRDRTGGFVQRPRNGN
jgi:hypothetical protein